MSRPRFSIVTAVHDVEAYLPDFIDSIEGQRLDADQIEVVAVDDGSTDASRALLDDWARTSRHVVKVLTKPRGGQASARNLGLEHATGEWVTFTDPDDMLDRDFFRVAARFASRQPGIKLMSGRTVILNERTGRTSESHPRRRQYVVGNRTADLDREPNVFLSSSAGGLFKLDRIRGDELKFDTRIRPNFEDGHFAVRYIMNLSKARIGILGGARYIYRKRAANNSTLQQSMGVTSRYTDVLEFGYLDVLHRAVARYGKVPPWLQHIIIYELSWYLSEDEKVRSTVRMPQDVVPIFHALLGDVLSYLEPAVVHGHTVRRLKPVWADILAHSARGRAWHSRVAARTKVDPETRLQRIAYRYVGEPPSEEFTLDGATIEPAYAKTSSHTYYRRPLISERVAWLPLDGSVRLRLGGKGVTIVDGWPPPARAGRPRSLLARVWLYARLRRTYVLDAIRRRQRKVVARLRSAVIGTPWRVLAQLSPTRSTFADAWVLMDRIHDADDNAERLFEYLTAERPDINAWFVVEAGTPAWERLRAAGVTRLVAHGSFRWKLLMLNCSWLLSSHADLAIARPPQITRIVGTPTWRFGFLQHGVIKDDLSLWLNQRDIDLFVVSTEAELESIVADGTNYVYTRKETRNTGLPRFDRLLAKGREVRPQDRDLVIVAPTWRNWLARPLDRGSQRREVDELFWTSDYVRNWEAVLRSPRIAEAAERRGWRLGFMPHPNLQPVLGAMALPPNVEPLTFAGNDVQGLYARCALLVTDYSSVAFNTAYLDRPVVYFQFDLDRMMGGEHVGRQGYYDYERDGFGPVATEVEAAVDAIVEAIDHGSSPTPMYQRRIDETFPDRDGQACRRVVAAVEELSRPYRVSSLWVGSPPVARREGVMSSGRTG
ncbi:MAG TPA: CDP-glycerol glycerophosphotransferase family protein [Candidatus Limnocylindrales bacterium]|nr:CDP-glycerol glycerophosphotransferase family protein [Candidatus Limnocylindrales bacterium]